MATLEDRYEELHPLLKRCAAEAREILITIVGQLTGSHLIRGQVAEARVKRLSSIQKKADREGWTDEQALELLTDAVGFRIVCSNIEDAYRIVDAIKGSTRFDLPDDACRISSRNRRVQATEHFTWPLSTRWLAAAVARFDAKFKSEPWLRTHGHVWPITIYTNMAMRCRTTL